MDPKKAKSQRKPKSKKPKPSVVNEESKERTISNVCGDSIPNEEDIEDTSQVQKFVLEPITSSILPQVSTPPSSQIMPPTQPPSPNESNIFANFFNDSILNLS